MTIQITIRNVPEEVRDKLASRAALNRQSMQEFLLCQLERLVDKPPVEVWMQGVRDRKLVSNQKLTTADILEARDADRK